MTYEKTIQETCEAIRVLLSGTGLLQSAHTLPLTGFKNLWAAVPELTRFPAAIVSAGRIEPEDMGATRNVEIVVFLVDRFRGLSDRASSGHALVDGVCDALTADAPGRALAVGNVHWTLDSVLPVDLDDKAHTGWQISLDAHMGFVEPETV